MSLHLQLSIIEYGIRDIPQLRHTRFGHMLFERRPKRSWQPMKRLLRLRLLTLAVGKKAARIRVVALQTGRDLRLFLADRHPLRLRDPLTHFIRSRKGLLGQVVLDQ